jgi:hypothetical protein
LFEKAPACQSRRRQWITFAHEYKGTSEWVIGKETGVGFVCRGQHSCRGQHTCRGRLVGSSSWISFCIDRNAEGIVKRRTLIWVAALNFAVAGVGCSSARGDERNGENKANSSGDAVTVTGCLSSGQDGRFALTAAPDEAVSTPARGLDGVRNTYSYVLVGGDNLQAHLGKRVEVIGTVSGSTKDIDHADSKKTESAPAAGGNDTPTVKTKEAIDLEVRQLNVREVRDLASTCTP